MTKSAEKRMLKELEEIKLGERAELWLVDSHQLRLCEIFGLDYKSFQVGFYIGMRFDRNYSDKKKRRAV